MKLFYIPTRIISLVFLFCSSQLMASEDVGFEIKFGKTTIKICAHGAEEKKLIQAALNRKQLLLPIASMLYNNKAIVENQSKAINIRFTSNNSQNEIYTIVFKDKKISKEFTKTFPSNYWVVTKNIVASALGIRNCEKLGFDIEDLDRKSADMLINDYIIRYGDIPSTQERRIFFAFDHRGKKLTVTEENVEKLIYR